MKKIIIAIILFASFSAIGQDSLAVTQFVNKWIGKPYRFGGTTERGIDCSAFSQRFYKEVLNIEIPRTCYYQMKKAIPIDFKDLLPGDIIFFTSKVSLSGHHCGIYIGNDQFIHASNSREGVKISCVDQPMYQRLYLSAGRYK